METIECSACCAKTNARPPNRAFWGLIAAFWVASLAVGFGAAQGQGYGIVLVATWAAMATSVVLLARRVTTWTCAECGSTVTPPVQAAYRRMHPRHA